jgi:starvation-inducible DNA-binding protein
MSIGILLSDDLLFTSRITGHAQALGLRVTVARTPQAVIELAQQHQPGGVLLDLHHPGLDLDQLLRALGTSRPRIVAYGSHVETAMLKAARQVGCELVLPRSAFVDRLPSELGAWLAAPTPNLAWRTTMAKQFPTRISLATDLRTEMVALLNQQLADTTDLYTQTKQAHWNIKGPQFIALHELFDKLAAELLPFADELAERVTALGGLALGTARIVASASKLPDWPAETTSGSHVVAALADRFAALATSTRQAIDTAATRGDAATADLFTGLSRSLDKGLWFLEAHLQG